VTASVWPEAASAGISQIRQIQQEGLMFKHLLLPTDGSPLSETAVRMGIRFAKKMDAKVTGFHVMPKFRVFTYRAEVLEATESEFISDAKLHAQRYLAVIEEAAKAADVTCSTVCASSDYPYEAIIEVAEREGCDLIMMASHGRSGIKGLLLGSETHKVLTHCRIPVLVYR
jgi:nucleotide-binding universal stress UspA family protein